MSESEDEEHYTGEEEEEEEEEEVTEDEYAAELEEEYTEEIEEEFFSKKEKKKKKKKKKNKNKKRTQKNQNKKEYAEESKYEEEEEEDYTDEEEGWIGKYYSSTQRILLVGEGDYSFSLCLARAFEWARNMVATSLDNHYYIAKKYSNGIENVTELEERGCLVLYGVDATKMSQHFILKTQRFDLVVYNFPHVGFLFPENSFCQIVLNKRLVKGFLKNAKVLLRGDGEIHVTHKEGYPYDMWDLVKNAEKLGLFLHEAVPFCKDNYPGYDNKRGHGCFSDFPFRLGVCTTFKFKIKINQ